MCESNGFFSGPLIYRTILTEMLLSCGQPCDPMDCSPPGFSVHGIFQGRILESVAISYSKESFQPRDRTCVSCVSCIGRWILDHWESYPYAAAAKSLQSSPTLCDPIDGSPPGSSVSWSLQARVLEWIAISFSNACMLSHFSRV